MVSICPVHQNIFIFIQAIAQKSILCMVLNPLFSHMTFGDNWKQFNILYRNFILGCEAGQYWAFRPSKGCRICPVGTYSVNDTPKNAPLAQTDWPPIREARAPRSVIHVRDTANSIFSRSFSLVPKSTHFCFLLMSAFGFKLDDTLLATIGKQIWMRCQWRL